MRHPAEVWAAWAVLGLLTGTTLVVGWFYHFGHHSQSFGAWVSPLALLTGLTAPVVARFVSSRRSERRATASVRKEPA